MLSIALSLAFASANLPASVAFGPVTNPANGHVYYLLFPASWTASEAEAIFLGGHLVTINDAAEHDWVVSTFGAAGSLWIGLSDASSEGSFAWASGEPLTYTHWQFGQPDNFNSDEDYALIWWPGFGPPFAGNWNDITDSNEFTPFGVVEVQQNAPANDNFAEAQLLSGPNGLASGQNTGATFEVGEPNHLDSGSHSIWYRWIVPTNGVAVVDLRGSTFDTVLAVYTGTSLTSLSLVAQNDDAGAGGSSRVEFAAVAGTTYHIAVDGFLAGTGDIALTYQAAVGVEPPTTNDPGTLTDTGFTIQSLTPAFSWNAVAGAARYGLFISKAPYSGAADLVYANSTLTGTTFQLPAGILVDATKYRWQMTSFDAAGTESVTSSFPRYFETSTLGPGIFTLSNDPPVWDITPPAGPAVQLRWTPSANATAYDLYRNETLYQAGLSSTNFYDWTGLISGEFYSYGVVARSPAGVRQSEVIFVGPMPFAPVPGSNDNFANAQPLSGATGLVFGGNTQATLEPLEPNHLDSGSHSIWYRWTVPLSGLAVVDLSGSNFDTVVAVYTGTSLDGLTLVAEDDDSEDDVTSRVVFAAVAGTTYYIAVDGFTSSIGNVVLAYEAGARVEPPTTNDPGTLTDTGFTIQSLTPAFGWNAVAGAARYGLFISKAPYSGAADLVYANSTLTGTTFQLPAGILVDATKYRWQMTSFDAAGTESVTSSFPRYFETNTLGPGIFTLSNDPPVWDVTPPAGPAVQLRWTPSANATAYDLYRNGTLYQAGLNVTNFYDKTGLRSGEIYNYFVVARNGVGTRQSAVIEVGPTPFAPVAGSNDNFVDAQPLSGADGLVIGENAQATLESGEPNHLGSGSHSIWYRWTVPISGLAVVDLSGSNFDTVVAVYTGTSLTGLNLIAENDDSEESFTSRASFAAVAGTTYYIAVDGFNSSTGDVFLSYAGEAGPTVETGAPTNVTSSGATLVGTVNANGTATTAYFEYGLTVAYGSTTSERSLGSGSSSVPLSQPLSGLLPGTTYHFRVVANSTGRLPTFGADMTFTTPAAVSTTFQFSNASYSVNENGQSVSVTVIKAGDLAAEVSVTTADGVASAGDYTPLTQTLQFSAQETTKQITILISNDDGPEPDEEFTLTLSNATSGATILGATASVTIVDNDTAAKPPQFAPPGAPPSAKGALIVNFINTPQTARWRLQGETTWRESGPAGIVSALTEGEYVVEFDPRGGPTPPPQTVVITGQGTQTMTVDYAVAVPAGSGTLTVKLEPPEVADPARVVAPEFRARWRFLGEDDNAWRNTGVTIADLRAGTYVLEFSPVPGRIKVPNLSVFVEPGIVRTVTALYQRLTNLVGVGPTALTLQEVTSQEPFIYCGQVQTDTGFGSGVVVKERVVLTAGHIVFDDAKLTFGTEPIAESDLSGFIATGIRWRFQRMQRELEPVPVVARGAYVLSGYAAARRAQQLQQARQRDAAALYFFERAGRGGFAESLVTDATNEWLLQPRRKTLAGYPIDDERIAEADRGRLHAVPNPAALVPFSHGTGGGNIYRTDAIHGLPGCSGGAVFVEGDDAHFYPAGIYLGGNEEALVRAIDADVVSLIALAQRSSGDGGENHASGGIVRVESGRSVASFTIGRVRVNLGPSGAVNGGAKWRLATEGDSAFRGSGQQASLPTGSYTLVFTDVPGFSRPKAQNGGPFMLNVRDDRELVIDAAYEPLAPPEITSGSTQDGTRGQPFRYRTEATGTVSTLALADGTLPLGLRFTEEDGVISGVPEQSGRFAVTIQASNSRGTDSVALTISIAPVLLNQAAVISRGQQLIYPIAATDAVTRYAADTLPAGFTLDTVTGVISGTATAAGTFQIPISITNEGGTATAILTLNVRDANELSGGIGQTFAPFQVTSPGPGATFSATDLPPGLSINPQTGIISGTPTASGSFDATVTIVTDAGTSIVSLRFSIDALLHVDVNGSGQITAGFAGDSFRTSGEALSILATPTSGHFFAGWTGGEQSRELTLNFSMRDGLTLQANFVPFSAAKGRYSGAITDQNSTDAGSLSLTVTRKGAFTGVIKFGRKRYNLRKVFDGTGGFLIDLSPRRKPAIAGQLYIDAIDGPPRITGTFLVDGATFAVVADRKISRKRTAHAGRYGLTLSNGSARDDQSAASQTNGFAMVVVSPTGEARVSGVLDDRTPFAAGAWLADDSTLPFPLILDGNRNTLTGVLTFGEDQLDEPVTGTFWFAPGDLRSRIIHLRGARY